MARYTDPVCRLCRAEGIKLFLKGERCNTGKCAIVRRAYRPGQHGQARHKVSEYGLRLREKQKARRIYGILEKQFADYYQKAANTQGVTGERLLQLLEMRLDNVVHRMGFAPSRPMARQVIRHGHILINGKKVDIPSFHVKPGMILSVPEKSTAFVKNVMATSTAPRVPAWMTFNPDALTGTISNAPTREDIDTPVREQLIVEYYSR